ncbi:MAG: hypothetical protein ACRDHZ_03820 [Ktedonobacteraceae bacterium]
MDTIEAIASAYLQWLDRHGEVSLKDIWDSFLDFVKDIGKAQEEQALEKILDKFFKGRACEAD